MRIVVRGIAVVALAAVSVAALAAGGEAVLGQDETAVAVAPPTAPSEPGWRWESYRTVKVQVPDSWQDSAYSHLWTCGEPKGQSNGISKAPLVGRPYRGPVMMIDCGPVSPLAERVPHLWFGGPNVQPGITTFDHGWASEVRVVDGVTLTVFGDDAALRRRILDSAEPISGTTDPNGCAIARPAVLADGQRPTGPGLSAIGEVSSIRVCAYSYGTAGEPSTFQAGHVISGDAARRLGDALRAAPPGVGPAMSASNCQQSSQRDDLLVTVSGQNGEQTVVVRYATCRSNGTDDGTTLRQLTTDTLVPLSKVLYAQWAPLPILDDLGAR
ncbi:hypothetical protein BWI15_27160 [Kribbella sp. ALI-6-A]|uniref:hypothetical protein n=1 Tax=Kribbella sp. ALI-6-A TaxID=1933817 RepID=UPI00097BEE3D|nr:hypothetical protein [Kribbella sp. ALI-6-A]ONI66871.1 hypothetical protein BWI15_27160 [Kribbella sp. ALI-6-A]